MIPDFTSHGVLPIQLEEGEALSPWRATPAEFVARFATTMQRVNIARNWLLVRDQLRASGLTGRQWLDGSYVENDGREPRDMDVLTLYVRPDRYLAEDQDDAFAVVTCSGPFDRDEVLEAHSLDVHYVDVSVQPGLVISRLTAKWCTLWSHRRDTLAKGIVEINLESDDQEALVILDQMESNLRRNAT